jgi:hypothetical protein
MIKVENIEVWGFEHAIRGMRNPMNSWNKSDSDLCCDCEDCKAASWCDKHSTEHMGKFVIGPNDLDLMKRLYQAGPEHRKYLRQIFVSMDITAPLYFWKEFDTYKVGTVANSCSTMHKIAAKKFEVDDFSFEHLFSLGTLRMIIEDLNYNRDKFIETKNKDYWWQMIQLLPSSYNQKRTITMNYENVVSMIHQRKGHKLDEWNILIEEFKEKLPYLNEIRKFAKLMIF